MHARGWCESKSAEAPVLGDQKAKYSTGDGFLSWLEHWGFPSEWQTGQGRENCKANYGFCQGCRFPRPWT